MATIRPDLFVVDGSNIATEGRSTPSLEQLNEAIGAFADERPGINLTVVVDATFGHRIEKSEVNKFDKAVANNDIVTPPAGAVGRGDAFVLSVANKANAGVLSNDSFQEFHGEYDWLFDEGRLVGGKPVPHVGWVFVTRSPVRGPKSRQAIREAAEETDEPVEASKERANRRVKKKAPVKRRAKRATSARKTDTNETAAPDTEVVDDPQNEPAAEPAKRSESSDEAVNDLMPFLEFVEHHPVGTRVTATVDSYSSHGAYARTDDVLVYLPLKLMGDPAPRKARDAVSIGDQVEVVVAGFVPDRRSIDAALPPMAHAVDAVPASTPTDDERSSEGDTAKAARKQPVKRAPAKKRAGTTSRRRSSKAAAGASATHAPDATPADESSADDGADQAASSRRSRRSGSHQQDSTEKTPRTKQAAAKKQAPARKKRAAAKKAPAKKVSPKKKAPAKKAPAKKAPAKKAPAKRKSAARKRPESKRRAAKSEAADQGTS